jgi:Fe-S cluster biogenesis protein NfuA
MNDRVGELLAGFDAEMTPHRARERAEELVRTLLAFYGEGLERILTIVHEQLAGDASDVLFSRLCEDKQVENILCLHGLHPLTIGERVEAALASVLPYVRSHKGNMTVARIEGDVVYLRLEGSCDGCPASAATLEGAVERAIFERVPEIREVRVEEVRRPGPAVPSEPATGVRVLSGV